MWRTHGFVILLVTGAGCAGAPGPAPEGAPALASAPASASAGALASASPRAATQAPAPSSAPAGNAPTGPVPTGGSVLVGDVVAPPSFDPKSTLDSAKPRLLSCYNQVRQTNTSLHGRLKLRINVNEAGTVLRVDAEEGGSANDPALTSCVGDAIKALRFPKPGGMATILVPLVFRPSPPSP